MAWPPGRVGKVGSGSNKSNVFRHENSSSSSSSSPTLQILAFETAKCISRLVALYKSLSDDEFFKLRKGPMKSPGVAFLNSTDEGYLLGLACKEMLENLNQAAAIVSRLGKKCIDQELNRFNIAYHNMNQGIIDVSNLDFNSKNVGKIIERMEKYASTTSILYASSVGLDELEISAKKLQKLNRNGCPKKPLEKTKINYLNEKISFQRKQVLHFRQISLWSQTFDKIVGLMARIVCVVYARICTIFGPFVPNLLCTTKNRHFYGRLYISNPNPKANYCFPVKKKQASKSGPIVKASGTKQGSFRFYGSELVPEVKGLGFRLSSITIIDKVTTKNKNIEGNTRRNQTLIQSAPENTVGASGLAVRYANVIIMAETYFYSTTTISNDARECMFDLLPISLKHILRGKLKSHWCKDAEAREGKQGLAEGWKAALEEIIGWLAPMAHDTLRWQQERNMERQNLDSKPTVLLLQTLHFSDLEKTEAGIVEVLVGLSCIYRYENQRKKVVFANNEAKVGG